MLTPTPPIFVCFGFVASTAADATGSRAFRFFKVSVVAGVAVPGGAIIAGLETTVRVTVVVVVVVSFFAASFFCFLMTSSISSASFNCTFAFFFSFSIAFSSSFFSRSNFLFFFAASVRF
jgi:phosphate/sulfate permease